MMFLLSPPALLCHKEPAPIIGTAPIIGPFRAWKSLIPYVIKNQRGASKIPPNRVFCVPKPLVGGFGGDELVLYGIRELAPATL